MKIKILKNSYIQIVFFFALFVLLPLFMTASADTETYEWDPDWVNTTEYVMTEQEPVDGIDYVITVPEGRDITILQIADAQVESYDGIRTNYVDSEGNEYEDFTRFDQVDLACFSSGIIDPYTRVYQYIEEGVTRAKPDIIVLTGDNVYGETDDSGESWLQLIEVLDSFKTPWIMIFGNHDNESQMGVNWQIDQVRNSEYGYIKDGDLENGNSNYTVGVKQGGKMKYVFYMLDTNGCTEKPDNFGEGMLPYNPDIDDIQQKVGIFPDQLEWIEERDELIEENYGEDTPSLMFLHIPPVETSYSVIERYADTYGKWPFYPNRDGDMGVATEHIGGFRTGGALFAAAKEANCRGMFMGHQHEVATSTYYKGIRLTYGLKTGTGSYHSPALLGTTKITISEEKNTFDVEYLFSEIEYPLMSQDLLIQ